MQAKSVCQGMSSFQSAIDLRIWKSLEILIFFSLLKEENKNKEKKTWS